MSAVIDVNVAKRAVAGLARLEEIGRLSGGRNLLCERVVHWKKESDEVAVGSWGGFGRNYTVKIV